MEVEPAWSRQMSEELQKVLLSNHLLMEKLERIEKVVAVADTKSEEQGSRLEELESTVQELTLKVDELALRVQEPALEVQELRNQQRELARQVRDENKRGIGSRERRPSLFRRGRTDSIIRDYDKRAHSLAP
jgi:uncharacterized protein YoxC